MEANSYTTKPLSRGRLEMLRKLFAEQADNGATIFHQAHAEELLRMCDMAIDSMELPVARAAANSWKDELTRLKSSCGPLYEAWKLLIEMPMPILSDEVSKSGHRRWIEWNNKREALLASSTATNNEQKENQ